MAFVSKYLNFQATKKSSDVAQAKIYLASDLSSPMLHVRISDNADTACALVLSSINDPRKMCVMHVDQDATSGAKTKNKHYLCVTQAVNGLAYTPLKQIEPIVTDSSDDDFFQVEKVVDCGWYDATWFENVDKIVGDSESRLYSSHLVSSSGHALKISCRSDHGNDPDVWFKILGSNDGHSYDNEEYLGTMHSGQVLYRDLPHESTDTKYNYTYKVQIKVSVEGTLGLNSGGVTINAVFQRSSNAGDDA